MMSSRPTAVALALASLLSTVCGIACAQEPSAPAPSASVPVTWMTPPPASLPPPVANPPSSPAAQGPVRIAVLASGASGPSSGSAAWRLAQAVYADDTLRPDVDEAHARVLAGEAPAAAGSPDLRELAELRAGVNGDDAASRQLLHAISASLKVRAILVVRSLQDQVPTARVYLAPDNVFDAAQYLPDAGTKESWTGAVQSLHRAFGGAGTITTPAAAIRGSLSKPKPAESSAHTPFYASPWFWGALGAAAFGAGAVYFATRDTSPSTIHLQVQVPK